MVVVGEATANQIEFFERVFDVDSGLSSDDQIWYWKELLGLIEDYRQGLVPLIVPLTLLKHHLNRCPVPEWVHQPVYLHPYPKELMLRNHV